MPTIAFAMSCAADADPIMAAAQEPGEGQAKKCGANDGL